MAPPLEVRQALCPLCKKASVGKRDRRLYKGYVCRKCFFKFENRRQWAYLLDFVSYFGLMFNLGMYLEIATPPIGGMPAVFGVAVYVIIWDIVSYALFFGKDGFRGKSLGKWLAGVTVVDLETREPIGFRQSFQRNLILLIPFAPLIIMFQMDKGPRIGDQWAKTRVVWDKYRHHFPFEERGLFCLKCGYNLTGNVSGICPECGEPVPIPKAEAAPLVVRMT